MDKKQKHIIIIGAGIGAIGVFGIFGYWYYKKLKQQTGFDGIENLRMPKLGKSRWQNIDSEYEEIDDYQDDRPILKKLKSAIVNKLYPQDYDRSQKDLESDLEEYEKLHKRRSRFTVYGSNYSTVSDRFKILETVGDPKAKREKGRFRVAGNLYRKDTPSGYNKNNRNVNFADLGIF